MPGVRRAALHRSPWKGELTHLGIPLEETSATGWAPQDCHGGCLMGGTWVWSWLWSALSRIESFLLSKPLFFFPWREVRFALLVIGVGKKVSERFDHHQAPVKQRWVFSILAPPVARRGTGHQELVLVSK